MAAKIGRKGTTMDARRGNIQRLSRRELLRIAGIGGLAVAGAGAAGPLIIPAAAAELGSGTLTQGIDDRTSIKTIVDKYFKTKYEGQHLLSPQGFAAFAGADAKANQFVQTESEKRDIELFQADLFNLRYTKYNYTLDFSDIRVDTASQEAFVTLSERNELVYACCAPEVSKLGGLKHTISLKQSGSEWQITDDTYEDDMRRMLKGAGGKEQLKTRMRDAKARGLQRPPDATPTRKGGDRPGADGQLCVMAEGDPHAYDRYQAWYQAYNWWDGYDPAYASYEPDDCTNFASQCLRSGGCAFDTGGGYQWYYFGPNIPDRTPSWTGVTFLWDYLINNDWTGPNGVGAWVDGVELADIVQFDYGNGWQHTPVIVNIFDRTFDGIMVATHSDPWYNRPISAWGGVGVRFAHIMYWRE